MCSTPTLRNVSARCTRAPTGEWAVNVPDIPGLFTQVHDLSQVSDTVRDAANTLGVAVGDVEVQVVDEF